MGVINSSNLIAEYLEEAEDLDRVKMKKVADRSIGVWTKLSFLKDQHEEMENE